MRTGDQVIRASTAATVVALAGVAAVVSYRHALEVVQAHGEVGATARMIPLTVDGLVFTASMVLLDSARRDERAPLLAKTALALGIGATVAANVLHGIAHGPIGAVVSAWPAVTLVVVVELLMSLIRRGRAGAEESDRNRGTISTVIEGDSPSIPPLVDPETDNNIIDSPLVDPATITLDPNRTYETATKPDPASSMSGSGMPADPFPDLPAGTAAWLNGSVEQNHDETGEDHPVPHGTTVPEDEDQAVTDARTRFRDDLATGSVPSIRMIKRELRVGYQKAKQIHAVLGGNA